MPAAIVAVHVKDIAPAGRMPRRGRLGRSRPRRARLVDAAAAAQADRRDAVRGRARQAERRGAVRAPRHRNRRRSLGAKERSMTAARRRHRRLRRRFRPSTCRTSPLSAGCGWSPARTFCEDAARIAGRQVRRPGACHRCACCASPDIDIVVNLTMPNAHFEVSHAALTAGKHVFCEKPLCVDSRRRASAGRRKRTGAA